MITTTLFPANAYDAGLYYLSADCNCLHTGARSMYTCLLNHISLQKW